MPETARVSVVIPCKDEGEWLRLTVDAVHQTAIPRSAEIIVVDDGSMDGSADYLRRGEGPANARVVQGGGLGVARARNRGASEARGDYLVFVDANVVPDAGWMEELLDLLQARDVALAGVGVRDYEHTGAVGLSNTFVNERIQGGWAPARSESEPFEVVSVIGCCVAARRQTFEDLGGFDSGHVLWGVEDVELGVRAWHLGHRCLVSPRAQVAHYFKYDKPRNFEVPWDLYDVNLLRFAFTYFSGRRLAAVLADARARANFARSLQMAVGNTEFWQRRAQLRARFIHDEAWLFEHFQAETALFEARVQELTGDWRPAFLPDGANPGLGRSSATLASALAAGDIDDLAAVLDRLKQREGLAEALVPLGESGFFAWFDLASVEERESCLYHSQTEFWAGSIEPRCRNREEHPMVTQRRQRCASCNALNVGVQNRCMLCGAALPEGSDLEAWQQSLATSAGQVCGNCGATLAGARFCRSCGAPAASGETAAASAPANACANCGASLNAGARFCISCGSPVASAETARRADTCRNCGTTLADDARFCISCGTPRS